MPHAGPRWQLCRRRCCGQQVWWSEKVSQSHAAGRQPEPLANNLALEVPKHSGQRESLSQQDSG
eukprot:4333065-Pyramimonas_sp.AAC.1